MLILGIDTSCDDTAASVVSNSSDSPKGEEDGTRIISNIVSGQTDIHTKYGGIVPELASRRHIEMIWPVVDEALKFADIKLEDLSAIAVCHGPGLIGSLLVGCSFAKALCFSKNIPLVAVNHLEGHVFSAFLEEPRPGSRSYRWWHQEGIQAFIVWTALEGTRNSAGQGMTLQARLMTRSQSFWALVIPEGLL